MLRLPLAFSSPSLRPPLIGSEAMSTPPRRDGLRRHPPSARYKESSQCLNASFPPNPVDIRCSVATLQHKRQKTQHTVEHPVPQSVPSDTADALKSAPKVNGRFCLLKLSEHLPPPIRLPTVDPVHDRPKAEQPSRSQPSMSAQYTATPRQPPDTVESRSELLKEDDKRQGSLPENPNPGECFSSPIPAPVCSSRLPSAMGGLHRARVFYCSHILLVEAHE